MVDEQPASGGAVQELVQVESLAQVGVQLLLFTLGLEFSLSKLRAVRSVALIGQSSTSSCFPACQEGALSGWSFDYHCQSSHCLTSAPTGAKIADCLAVYFPGRLLLWLRMGRWHHRDLPLHSCGRRDFTLHRCIGPRGNFCWSTGETAWCFASAMPMGGS